MSLKNILVHLDQTPESPTRYELALGLAQQHQARLSAYFGTNSGYFSQGGEKPLREETRSACADKASEAGVSFAWSVSDEEEATFPLTTRLIYQSVYADLCIIGKPDRLSSQPRDLPERLLVSSGHPVMMIPPAGSYKSIGQRVMIAWKAGRVSSRAVTDAMPFLKHAGEVVLISFSSDDEERKENGRTLEKMAAYLECHGVGAKVENRLIADISLGDALLNRAAEEASDLLVCGGTVDSQPGPLAEHLLRQTTVPVLMSS